MGVACFGIAAGICKFLPPVYESVATFTLDLRRAAPVEFGESALTSDGMSYAELFNTRYAEWRSEPVILRTRAYLTRRSSTLSAGR